MTVNTNPTKSKIINAALVAGGITAASNIAAYFIARASNVSLLVAIPPGSPTMQALPLTAVVLASIVPAFVGAAVLAILRRFAPRADLIFQILSAIIVVVSLGGPLRQPTDDATKFVLNLMHVLAGGIIVYGLTRPVTRPATQAA